MLRCILFLSALASLPAIAQLADPPDQAAPVGAPVTPVSAPVAPELTAEQKLERYRHDQINLLALRPEAESLLAASLLADPDANDKNRPAALKPAALLKRAQAIGESSPLVWWVTAASECRGGAKTCPATETLQKLESLDAENAAVWGLSLARAQQAKDAPAARAALASAAQAKRYNDYFGALVSALYHGQEVLPMSNELLNASRADASVAGFRLITAANIAVAKGAMPSAQALTEACKPVDPPDQALVADCISVARKMELSGSLMTQNIGLGLRESLLSASADLDALHSRRRSLIWQTQHMSELAGQLANDERVTRTYTQALAESGDESAAVYAVLRSQGVSLEPPPDWQPEQVKPAFKP